MKIKKIVGREILDSRGNPTVEVDVVLETEKLTESELAQIEDVVTRKTGYSIDSVTITSVSPKKDETTSSAGTNTENENEPEKEVESKESETKDGADKDEKEELK